MPGSLHPTGIIVGDSLVLHHVQTVVFERLNKILTEETISSPTIKLDFLKRTPHARSGRLIITKPSSFVEHFDNFADLVRRQIQKQEDLDRGDIWPGRSRMVLTWGPRERHVEPYGSLAYVDVDCPFLVVECVRSMRSQDMKRKAQDYIYGTRPPITFVIFIHIDAIKTRVFEAGDTGTTDVRSGEDAEGSAEEKKSRPAKKRSGRHDGVAVTVFKSVVTPTESGASKLSMTTIFNDLEVYPKPVTDKDVFPIKFSDVNYGSWEEFAAQHGIEPGPEPVCDISLSVLSEMAQPNDQPTCTCRHWEWDPVHGYSVTLRGDCDVCIAIAKQSPF